MPHFAKPKPKKTYQKALRQKVSEEDTLKDGYVSYSRIQGGFEVRIFKEGSAYKWHMTGLFGLDKLVEEHGSASSIDKAREEAERRYRAMKEKGGY